MKIKNFFIQFSLKLLFVSFILLLQPAPLAQAQTDIIINEVDADQSGTDSAEFIELYDGGIGHSDLSGLVLVFYNGSGDTSYQAFDLDGFNTDADGYFVLCGNSATTANCALDVAPDTNLIQNGADAVALYQADAADFPDASPVTTDNLLDALVYDTNDSDDPGLLVLLNAGQEQVNEGGSGDQAGHSNQRCANGSGGPRNTETYRQHTPTPGMENTCGTPGGTFGQCADPATFIHEVQGTGFVSPLNGAGGVVIEGIVTADFQENGQLNGFFMQEEDEDADADIATSEGIFVHHTGDDVQTGDLIRVQGDVREFFELTELGNVSQVEICDSGKSVTASILTLPAQSLMEFEQFEGMLLAISQPLTVNGNFNLGRFGELILSNARQFQFTQEHLPDVDAYANHLAEAVLHQVVLDDGRSNQNPDPVIYPPPALSAANTLRNGYMANIEGVLSFAFGQYRIQPVAEILFSADNPRTASPPQVGGNLKIASFNVLNYFSTLDTGANICGPSANAGCRGADSTSEFTRQRDKIIEALMALDADIVGLIEIENNASASLENLVDGLNSALGTSDYAYINTGTIGSDAIKVGIIYRPARVTPAGSFALLTSATDPLFNDDKNRPSLAQSFAEANGTKFTLTVNHFKSKGSPCDDIGDPDQGDGQGNCSNTRSQAARALANWLASDPTQSGSNKHLILGDLNAYAREDAITALTDGGFINLIESFVGPSAYSFVFGARAGYLDHALASTDMFADISGAALWHINADEPRVLDYNEEFKSAEQIISLYNSDPYRSSDHDPVLIGLSLNSAPDCGSAQPSQHQLWPPNHKFHDIGISGISDPDGDQLSISINSIFQDEAVNARGSGNTAPDGQGIGTSSAQIRAERAGTGNGRVYHIGFSASDNQGNSCSGTVKVGVPKNKGKQSVAIDDGRNFDSTIEH